MLDEYYTPRWAAEALADALPSSFAGSVLDPAVGGGALLEAVEARFGSDVSLIGLDVSDAAARRLRKEHPSWSVSTADLLRPPSRAASQAWRTARGDGLAAVVMNPPFSYRGNGGALIEYEGFRGRVAPSMHFLTEVVRSLNPSEGVFAILPDGALDAERHVALWEQLNTRYDIARLARLKNSSFQGARVSTSIVRLGPRQNGISTPSQPISIAQSHRAAPMAVSCRCVEIVRGRVPLHALPGLSSEESAAPFIHTTDLAASTLSRTAPDRLADTAPLLLISRVGRWRNPRLLELGRVVLSDCLFGIRPKSKAALEDLAATLPALESDFQLQMRGTGAPYLTLSDVERVLRKSGWHAHVVKASEPTGLCCCPANGARCSPLPAMRVDPAEVSLL